MIPTRRRLLIPVPVAAATLVVAMTAGPGAAAEPTPDSHAKSGVVAAGSATDPDDTHGRLDIGRVRDRAVEMSPDHFLITYRVTTLTPFATDRLDVDDRNFVLELNRDAEAGSERNVRISARDGALVAEVISNATRETIATVTATRPDDYSVQISGPRRLIGARTYFWASNFHAQHSPRCGVRDGFRAVCQDDVPEDGWLRLERPAWPVDAHGHAR
jgi:hypothetical protein